ncbi:DUF6807 family protein [Niabella hibiscisoli]|uniref:DUF6807 family protein n=1 Tax=Niabella hibiscisoli TaxID=1825928 RepID=UPI00293E72B8|nr:DUF6807 family protein [Niabella hibiscisoli]
MYKAQPNDQYYILDITSQLSCAGSSPVLLLEYRYGGIGIRATEQWDNKNSTTLTSEEKTVRRPMAVLPDGVLRREVSAMISGAGNDEPPHQL